ncbi:MAG TPA: SdrD B-like domain-containing protein [Kiritimatiellia bacterium]|nr:SdrD B-like domain-containing protein [Kiritimatiellia bacterium]
MNSYFSTPPRLDRSVSRISSLFLLIFMILTPAVGLADRISGFVWNDLNTNGIREVGEPGITGVVVRLYDSDTNFVNGAFSDSTGSFAFTNIANGFYFLEFVPFANYAPTLQNQGGDDDVDSDINLGGLTDLYEFTGVAITNVGAGYYELSPGISITKLAGDAPDGIPLYVTNGTWVTYTYIVTNTGNVHLSNLFVFDDIIDDFVGTLECPALLAPGDSITFSTTVVITASVTNNADVFAEPVDFKDCSTLSLPPVFDTDDAVVIVVAPGFNIVKTLTSPVGRAAAVGENISFTISVINTGDVALAVVPLVDTYDPALLGFVAATQAVSSVIPGTLTWNNIGPVAIGASTSVIVHYTALSSTVNLGSRTNVVVSSPTSLTNLPPLPPKTNEAPYDISNPEYTLTKTLVSPDGRPAVVGETIVFNLTVENTGDVLLQTVPLVDTFDPVYLGFLGATQAADSVGAGNVSWTNVGPLSVGASTSVVVHFEALASTVAFGQATNVVVASPTTPPDQPPVPPQTNDAPYEIGSLGFTVDKTLVSPSGRAAAVGETITFNIVVVNTGDVAFATVPLEDTFDSSYLSYASAIPAADSVIAGQLNWNNVGPLPAGSSTTVVVNLTAISSTLSLAETNIVVASPTTPPEFPPVPPQTNDAPYEISDPRYILNKSVTSPVGRAAAVGETLVFTLTVTNNGDVTLVTLPLSDTYDPAFLSFINAVPPADTAVAGSLTWNNIGPLPAGSVTSVVVNFTALQSTIGIGSETNIVIATPTTPPDEPPVPPQTNDVPYDISAPGYTIVKSLISPSGRSAAVGETLVFQLTINNTGDVTLVTVPLVDTFDPAYLAFVTATQSVDVVAAGSLTWNNVGPLSAGASTSVLVHFTALQSTVGSGSETNTVVATPTTPPDQPPVPPRTNEVPYDISSPGFTVVKTILSPSGRAAQVGETIIFELTVNNTGDVNLVTVPLVDTYDPAYLSFVLATQSVSSIGVGTLTWNDIGPLAVGASTSVVVHFEAIASTVGPGSRTNIVVASPTTPPDQPPVPPKTNDVPFDISNPGYSVTKTLLSPSGRPAIVGEPVVFRLNVVNTGDVAFVTVPLTDTFEAVYLTYQSAVAPPDVVGAGTLAWNDIGPLPVGASTSVVVTFNAASITSGQNRTNVVVASPTTPPDQPPVPPKTNSTPYSIMYLFIGDTVWVDINGNGIPDENLNVQGLNNVRVDLFSVSPGVTNFVDFRLSSTANGQRGYYAFSNLVFGTYFVRVVVGTVPATVNVNTTPLRYDITPIPVNGIFDTADFGFRPGDPTAVELISFTAEVDGDSVLLLWETATELDNMGFNLYRASSPAGERTKINDKLIPGRGTGIGGNYQYFDPDALANGTYYYWLEDVEYDNSTREHGPLRVEVGEVVSDTAILAAKTISHNGLVMLTSETFANSGINPATINPAKLRVYVDGEEVAAHVTASGNMFAPQDYILVYVGNADGNDVEISVGESGVEAPLRMNTAYVPLDFGDGDTWVGIMEDGATKALFDIPGKYVRYMIAGFGGFNIVLLDVTDSENPVLLLGAYVVNSGGKAALYFSNLEDGVATLFASEIEAVEVIDSFD